QATPRSIFERMVMPGVLGARLREVRLLLARPRPAHGHDALPEFLGDPDHILRSDGPPPHMQR
ncbi:MAG: hypothetical protein M5U28_05450, partial [Sandaracinaceae bacterium]|nr:hypothetical protein [Sandaracinaceae bacterium]